MKQLPAFRPCFALLGRNWWRSKSSKLPDSQADSLPFPAEKQAYTQPVNERNRDFATTTGPFLEFC
jgi:hypothetical protein